jgi:hypothetical protein
MLLVVASHVCSASSGFVLDASKEGHDASAIICGGVELDHVFHFPFRALCKC